MNDQKNIAQMLNFKWIVKDTLLTLDVIEK